MGESTVVQEVHEFAACLERSLELSEDLDSLYRCCFPHLESIEVVTDLELQRLGVDKILTLANGKKIYIDEKVRDKDYPDFFLEEYSVKHKKVVGWLGRDKLTDYIVYVFKPSKKVFFLSFLLLQRVWVKYYREWKKKYPPISVPNDGYVTTGLPIPKDVLFEALSEALTI